MVVPATLRFDSVRDFVVLGKNLELSLPVQAEYVVQTGMF